MATAGLDRGGGGGGGGVTGSDDPTCSKNTFRLNMQLQPHPCVGVVMGVAHSTTSI